VFELFLIASLQSIRKMNVKIKMEVITKVLCSSKGVHVREVLLFLKGSSISFKYFNEVFILVNVAEIRRLWRRNTNWPSRTVFLAFSRAPPLFLFVWENFSDKIKKMEERKNRVKKKIQDSRYSVWYFSEMAVSKCIPVHLNLARVFYGFKMIFPPINELLSFS